MRRPFPLFVYSLLFALIVGLAPQRTQAQPSRAPSLQSGSDLLAAVNSLRSSHGLPAYNADPILMGMAQAQADYMAATGSAYGHLGPGGSSPIQRAIAAGYAAVFFSENWQSGSGLSPSGAVSAWQGDAPHINTMLSANLVDAGAGASKRGNVIYYVLDAGAIGPPSGGNGTPLSGTNVPAATTGPSQVMVPISLNTPGPDGLVYHEVAYGQTLWSIAIAYGTKIEAIKALNNLTDIAIQPGQKLLVLKGPTPVPSTVTASPTRTRAPATRTALPAEAIVGSPSPDVQVSMAPPVSRPRVPAGRNFNLTAIAVLAAALAFAVLGTWMSTRKPS